MPRTSLGAPASGRLQAGSLSLPCAIGRNGITHGKREGDLASPAGRFRLLCGFIRPATKRPLAPWPLRAIRPTDGWCDDPQSPAYNRLLRRPSGYGYEKLWRNDGLYDLIIVLDYNLRPRRKGRGSAIFMHCAAPDLTPTAGCIALRAQDLRKLLPRLAQKTVLIVK